MCISSGFADPLLSSWYTERSGSYARIYQTDDLNAVTTWSRGQGSQTEPTYAGIHEISYTDEWVYIRTTNLASYIMGPWYTNEFRTNLFPNYPDNQAAVHRFSRNPTDPITVINKIETGGGAIGLMVNGVRMFDSRDAFSYSTASAGDARANAGGEQRWNRDAYVNESITFDAGNAHQAGANYHYHANPPALRHQLGDSVDYDPVTNVYTENFNGEHSPIIAWVDDGLPVYGPYGYDDPLDADSGVRRMISGFQPRSDNTRASWPAWATRIYEITGRSFLPGPPISANFPLGRYMEDNDYKGDLGMTLGLEFDLNEYNVRWCVTPEFPNGIWAYFTCIEADGTPTFPYNIVRTYFGEPSNVNFSGIPGADDTASELTILFEGGPEKEEVATELSVNTPATDQVIITWSAVEGGTYQISETTDLANDFTSIGSEILAEADQIASVQDYGSNLPSSAFYKITRTDLNDFDDEGFVYEQPSAEIVESVTITVTMNNGGPRNLNVLPSALTFEGESIDIASANVTRPSRPTLSLEVQLYGRSPGDYNIVATYPPGNGPVRTGTYTIHPNILLMIVDDWGTDSSPLDNSEVSARLPNMPNFSSLAASGVRFTRAYAQPVCSPTRATIMTGRQPFQHKVSYPTEAAQFSGGSGINEITLPEIFTLQGAPHQMLLVGKWHLGGNNSGYTNRGGWPEFYGINGGGVTSYYNWNKNSNGISNNSTTYTTTDQVNEATNFILDNTSTGTPWFTWVAFNAVHSPFEEPPLELAPIGGYSAKLSGESVNAYNYRKMCEALDTEIGRLMEVVDPAQTHIIMIGDNGTPVQAIQAPFGAGRAKGSIYNGGTNVPMVVTGPAVNIPSGSTSDTLVHCVDLFSTILEMADIDESSVAGLAAMNIQSTSILPILNGTDTEDRVMIAEVGGAYGSTHARAIITDDYPDYKLIIFGDPDVATDTPYFEFYNIGSDWNEQNRLGYAPNQPYEISTAQLDEMGGNVRAAYDACLAVDLAIGGGYSDQPTP